jgi:hypothetical protein
LEADIMAVISKGITLAYGENVLTNLQEIPDLGGDMESIEITTLADAAHMYTNGLLNYGDSLEFKFLYEAEQFAALNALEGSQQWKVTLPDGETCSFGGECSVRLDGVGIGAALTYTLAVKPDSEMVWA